MMKTWLILAAVDAPLRTPPIEAAPSRGAGMALQDILLLAGVAAILALILFLWVYLTRKNSRRSYTEGGAKVLYRADKHELDPKHRKVRRRRQAHPDNLPRNPTLAEAGGLPPIRTDEPAEPAS